MVLALTNLTCILCVNPCGQDFQVDEIMRKTFKTSTKRNRTKGFASIVMSLIHSSRHYKQKYELPHHSVSKKLPFFCVRIFAPLAIPCLKPCGVSIDSVHDFFWTKKRRNEKKAKRWIAKTVHQKKFTILWRCAKMTGGSCWRQMFQWTNFRQNRSLTNSTERTIVNRWRKLGSLRGHVHCGALIPEHLIGQFSIPLPVFQKSNICTQDNSTSLQD